VSFSAIDKELEANLPYDLLKKDTKLRLKTRGKNTLNEVSDVNRLTVVYQIAKATAMMIASHHASSREETQLVLLTSRCC
jgi:hypothetical protein